MFFSHVKLTVSALIPFSLGAAQRCHCIGPTTTSQPADPGPSPAQQATAARRGTRRHARNRQAARTRSNQTPTDPQKRSKRGQLFRITRLGALRRNAKSCAVPVRQWRTRHAVRRATGAGTVSLRRHRWSPERALHTQMLSVLTPEQKATLDGCAHCAKRIT